VIMRRGTVRNGDHFPLLFDLPRLLVGRASVRRHDARLGLARTGGSVIAVVPRYVTYDNNFYVVWNQSVRSVSVAGSGMLCFTVEASMGCCGTPVSHALCGAG